MGGAADLDYGVLPVVMKAHRIKKKDHSDIFARLRLIEGKHWQL